MRDGKGEGKMGKKTEYHFQVKLEVRHFWLFSMYHATRGAVGLFSLIFTVAAVFLMVTKWPEVDTSYRVLLVICVLMFTVWQPGILYLKARSQAKLPAMKKPLELLLDEEGMTVRQENEELTVLWTQIFRVVERSHMLILYTDSIHAYLLTNRCMGEKKEGVLELIQKYVPKDKIKKKRGVWIW